MGSGPSKKTSLSGLARFWAGLKLVLHTAWSVVFGWNIGTLFYRFRPNTFGFGQDWLGPAFILRLFGLHKPVSLNAASQQTTPKQTSTSHQPPPQQPPPWVISPPLPSANNSSKITVKDVFYAEWGGPGISPIDSIQTMSEASQEWKGDTPSTQALIDRYAFFEKKGTSHLINMRGDNGCFIHALMESAFLNKNIRTSIQANLLNTLTVQGNEVTLIFREADAVTFKLTNKDAFLNGYKMIKTLYETAEKNSLQASYAYAMLLEDAKADILTFFKEIIVNGLLGHLDSMEISDAAIRDIWELAIAREDRPKPKEKLKVGDKETLEAGYNALFNTYGIEFVDRRLFQQLVGIPEYPFLYENGSADKITETMKKQYLSASSKDTFLYSEDGRHYKVLSDNANNIIIELKTMLNRLPTEEDQAILENFCRNLASQTIEPLKNPLKPN